jgi:hypothetical protein
MTEEYFCKKESSRKSLKAACSTAVTGDNKTNSTNNCKNKNAVVINFAPRTKKPRSLFRGFSSRAAD